MPWPPRGTALLTTFAWGGRTGQSISLAFYFAARARGTIAAPGGLAGERVDYTSTARVLLSGLGADELLGGYSRHRKTFWKTEEGDWNALVDELQMVSPIPPPTWPPKWN